MIAKSRIRCDPGDFRVLILLVSGGDLNPTPVNRALAPQASARLPFRHPDKVFAALAQPPRRGRSRTGWITVTEVAPVPKSRSKRGEHPPRVDEVVDLVSSLIRFDTSNTGELSTTKGEEECARWVAQRLEEAGYLTEYVESGQPGRGNVFARLEGDPGNTRGIAPPAHPPRRRPGRTRRLERAPVPPGRCPTVTSGAAAPST